MHWTNRRLLFVVTAVVEGATGLGLLALPAIVFALLLGRDEPAIEAIFVGRIAGASLLAMAIASWMARDDASTPAQRGSLTGILVYDVAASILLAFAGGVLKMAGILLWPAVAFHAVLAVWCIWCWRPKPMAGASGAAAVDHLHPEI